MDEAIAKRIIKIAGHSPGTVYGKRGSGYLEKNIRGFNKAAQGTHYLALVDFMDTRLSCPAEVITRWLPNRSSYMLLRVVVRELESWILADRANMAKFLRIDIAKVPMHPEEIQNPKQTLINLARGSRSKRVRSALVPDKQSTAQVGKLYTSEAVRFIENHWDVENARRLAPSLDRCLRQLESIS